MDEDDAGLVPASTLLDFLPEGSSGILFCHLPERLMTLPMTERIHAHFKRALNYHEDMNVTIVLVSDDMDLEFLTREQLKSLRVLNLQ